MPFNASHRAAIQAERLTLGETRWKWYADIPLLVLISIKKVGLTFCGLFQKKSVFFVFPWNQLFRGAVIIPSCEHLILILQWEVRHIAQPLL